MLVTMVTPISSHVKDKNSIFTAHDEDMIFLVKGKLLVFHQYLYNKIKYTQEDRESSSSGFLSLLFFLYFHINEATVKFLVARGNSLHPALNNSTASCKPKGKGDLVSHNACI